MKAEAVTEVTEIKLTLERDEAALLLDELFRLDMNYDYPESFSDLLNAIVPLIYGDPDGWDILESRAKLAKDREEAYKINISEMAMQSADLRDWKHTNEFEIKINGNRDGQKLQTCEEFLKHWESTE